MSAVPQKRRPAGSGSSAGAAPQAAPAGLTVVPRVRRGHAARRARKVSKLGAMFRSNPVRVTVGLLVVSGVVFGLVLLNIYVAQTSFHLSDLQRQAAELQTEQRRLRYEVAKAESPERIVEMGTTLGLVAPVSQEYLDGPHLTAGGRPFEPDVAAEADSNGVPMAGGRPTGRDVAAQTDGHSVPDPSGTGAPVTTNDGQEQTSP